MPIEELARISWLWDRASRSRKDYHIIREMSYSLCIIRRILVKGKITSWVINLVPISIFVFFAVCTLFGKFTRTGPTNEDKRRIRESVYDTPLEETKSTSAMGNVRRIDKEL